MTASEQLQEAAYNAAASTFAAGAARDRMINGILREFRDWMPPGTKPPLPGFAQYRFAVQAKLDGRWVYVVEPATLEPLTFALWDEAEEYRSIWNDEGSRVVKAPAPH